MTRPKSADPVKLIVAVLWSDAPALELALVRLEERWGRIDFSGGDHSFDATHYYDGEMGSELRRRIVSFGRLVPPESIREAKLICNEIEDTVAAGGGRKVNLDIGYIDHNKVVLASAKYAGQKIHLGDGIYADMIARYRDGKYRPFEWTFPDFRDGRYDTELGKIRADYLEQLRSLRRGDD
ncbi:MAG: hypothetical protein H6Q06_2563 [Acidobacteria bacterium]|nr:hypothetical protein [Acidobacteriota bacterium]